MGPEAQEPSAADRRSLELTEAICCAFQGTKPNGKAKGWVTGGADWEWDGGGRLAVCCVCFLFCFFVWLGGGGYIVWKKFAGQVCL